jgi:hypothetical protein
LLGCDNEYEGGKEAKEPAVDRVDAQVPIHGHIVKLLVEKNDKADDVGEETERAKYDKRIEPDVIEDEDVAEIIEHLI